MATIFGPEGGGKIFIDGQGGHPRRDRPWPFMSIKVFAMIAVISVGLRSGNSTMYIEIIYSSR